MRTHRSRDIWDRWGKVQLQACENKTGNAANVRLLHELKHGAPRRKQVRKLSTDTGDKRGERRLHDSMPGHSPSP